jgi:hypothetical protein
MRKEHNPRIKCKDGFTISVQGRDGAYCLPREDYPATPYTHVECGYPETGTGFGDAVLTKGLREYFDGGVYPYVPVEIVQSELDAHGGIAEGRLPSNVEGFDFANWE